MITRKPGTILVEKTSETTTGRVGLHWVSESMRHSGLKKKIEYRFRSRKSNREKTAWEKIEAAVLTILSGGSCVEDLEYLRADAGLVHSLGKKDMISTKIGRFLCLIFSPTTCLYCLNHFICLRLKKPGQLRPFVTVLFIFVVVLSLMLAPLCASVLM